MWSEWMSGLTFVGSPVTIYSVALIESAWTRSGLFIKIKWGVMFSIASHFTTKAWIRWQLARGRSPGSFKFLVRKHPIARVRVNSLLAVVYWSTEVIYLLTFTVAGLTLRRKWVWLRLHMVTLGGWILSQNKCHIFPLLVLNSFLPAPIWWGTTQDRHSDLQRGLSQARQESPSWWSRTIRLSDIQYLIKDQYPYCTWENLMVSP